MKDDNVFDNMDFKELFESQQPLINNYGDQARKEIGDRVSILDYSSMTTYDGVEPLDYDDFDDRDYYIVIETNLMNYYDSYFVRYKQDLVIAHPKTKILYRISLQHVKLL